MSDSPFREWRRQAGKNWGDVAEMLDCTVAHVSAVERGLEQLTDSEHQKVFGKDASMSEPMRIGWHKCDVCGWEFGEHRPDCLAYIKSLLDDLTDMQREELFSQYCKHCGSKDRRCQCWNDE